MKQVHKAEQIVPLRVENAERHDFFDPHSQAKIVSYYTHFDQLLYHFTFRVNTEAVVNRI